MNFLISHHERFHERFTSFDVKVKNKIGIWNVRLLYTADKLANAIKEMKRLQVDIPGISENRWINSKSCNETIFYYSTADKSNVNHRYGVRSLIIDSHEKYIRNSGLLRENNNILLG